jgi:lipoyl(octanoyl) transferase
MSLVPDSFPPQVLVVRAGQVPYGDALEAQKLLEAARSASRVPDLLLLLEHPPVFTRGRRSSADELPMGEEWYLQQGIEIADTNRGGRVTYHGPGQLVGYPIVSLKPFGDDVHDYLRRMEILIIEALAEWGVEAVIRDGLTGVWTPEGRKVGSIGVHVNRGVTTHGFAINVNNDLQPFEWIVPCGIESCRMTSLARERGTEQDLAAFATTVCNRFGDAYRRTPIEIGVDELIERIPDLRVPAGAAAALP